MCVNCLYITRKMDYSTCDSLQVVRLLTPYQRHYLENFFQHQVATLQAKDDQTIVLGTAVLFGLFVGSAGTVS